MKRLATCAMAGLLALAPASVLAQRYDDDLDNRWSRRMAQEMPESDQMDDVLTMVNRLDSLMEKIEKHAHKEARDVGIDRREADSLRWIEILTARVDMLEDTMERNPDRPSLSVEDFERTLGAYLMVDDDMRTLYRSGLLHEDFRRVQDLMDDLVSFYGGYPEIGSRRYERLTRDAQMDHDRDDEFGLRLNLGPGNRINEELHLDIPDMHVGLD